MHVLAAPDKFRGSLSAPDVAAAIAQAVTDAGGTCTQLPLADGGEGTLDAFGGANRDTLVTGPSGYPVHAGWRLEPDGRAIIEMAQAAGLQLADGAEANDPLSATTRGVGELIAAALRAGAQRIIIGMGGSATTDGGLGAVRALEDSGLPRGALDNADILVCCDVRTPFTMAPQVFGPQKGASPSQVAELTERLQRLQDHYKAHHGVDVSELPGAGAAGGLAGGLAALGATLVPGFDLIAAEAGLTLALHHADLVVTGEGQLDAGSFDGKVVGGVLRSAQQREIPALAIVGHRDESAGESITSVSLLETYGHDRAWFDTAACIKQAIIDHLRAHASTKVHPPGTKTS